MADIKSFPNNQSTYVGAEWVMRWLHGRTSGVFAAGGNAAVSAVSGSMAVSVSDGIGWLSNDEGNGIVWWNDKQKTTGSPLTLSISTAHGSLPRIDRVVVEWETTTYATLPQIKILAGTPAATPQVPSLTNNAVLRQISLARVRIPAGTTAITSGMITDERLDASVCGLVTESLTIDTSMVQAQMTDLLNTLEDELERINNGSAIVISVNGKAGDVTLKAEDIGIDDFGLTATDIQGALEEIQDEVDNIAQGAIADGSVTTAKLADIAVTADKIAVGAVTSEKISTYAVNTAQIAAGAVNAAKVAADAITTPKIVDGAVTSTKIRDNNVREQHIGNYQVSERNLATSAVTAGKIASNAVETDKIKDLAVTAAKLASSAVETAKIKDGAVTDAKLAATAAIRMKKLWENASHNSSFAAQDITLNLSGYSMVAIEYINWPDTDWTYGYNTCFCKVGSRAVMPIVYYNGNTVGTRQADVSTSKITFYSCYYNNTGGNDTYAVPVRIYGIKGVQ